MEELSREAVTGLLSQKPKAPAVTIYLPTHRAATPPNMTQDQIRFKNHLTKAIEILKNRDDGRELEQYLTERLNELLEDRNFWENQTEGLLVCARPGMFRMFNLPVDTEEYVAVADHFHLAPVFGVLQDMQEYYVLVVNQHRPRLFKGTLYGLEQTTVELPETLEQGLNLDEAPQKRELQGSSVGSSMSTSGYNGRGSSKDPADDERLRFWRMVDQQINAKANTKLPLILAGVTSEVSEFRAISHYPKILKASVTGSFNGTAMHDLYEPALKIIRKELLNPMHDDVIAEYKRAKGQAPELAARDLAAIADAAEKGRVDKLLLADIRYTTDTVRDDTVAKPVLTFPPVESAQAVNDIAYQIWNAGGQIIDIERGHMPERGALMLATLRY